MSYFKQDIDGKTANFYVNGDFIQSRTQTLRSALLDVIKNGATVIRIDLTEVNHIDSPSIGLLVSAHNTLKGVSGELIVDKVNPRLAELFSVLQLDKRFKVNSVQG